MKFPLVYVAAFAAVVVAQTTPFTIDTPTDVVQCEYTTVTWSGGSPTTLCVFSCPVIMNRKLTFEFLVTEILKACGSAVSASNINGTPVAYIGEQTVDSTTWQVAVAAGTTLVYKITDWAGEVALSGPFTIQPGPDCLP
ncbi:hypothetical protein BU15DRAFT_70409 [Melanogaster broomeanus]|nr:hypothetical protein BU15DRAFT_70409 [Melanogaster broomeanus]